MLHFARFRSIIDTTFVEQGTDQTVGKWKIPLAKLPEDVFTSGAVLNMSGKQYVVVSADPPTRAKTLEGRNLRLVVRLNGMSRP